MTVVPLGTGSSTLRLARHFTSAALLQDQANGRALLFDCGDGTQRQLLKAKLKINRIEAVFVTHLHSDHFMGLPALMSTMSLLGRYWPLTLALPKRLCEALERFPGTRSSDLLYPVHYVPIPEEETHLRVFENEHLTVEARTLKHNTPTTGFRIEERERLGRLNVEKVLSFGVKDRDRALLKKGQFVRGHDGCIVTPDMVLDSPPSPRVFSYITDTMPCKAGVQLAQNADLLIHEATFANGVESETAHSNSVEAATIARQANAKKLLLTHFGASLYNKHRIENLVREAQQIFPATEAAEELKRYRIPVCYHKH